MIYKNMNLKFAIRFENLIFLDVFKKGVIFHHFLQFFTLKKGTFDDAIHTTVSAFSV